MWLAGSLQACDWLAYQHILFCLQTQMANGKQQGCGQSCQVQASLPRSTNAAFNVLCTHCLVVSCMCFCTQTDLWVNAGFSSAYVQQTLSRTGRNLQGLEQCVCPVQAQWTLG